MTTIVYRHGARMPTEHLDLVLEQMEAGVRYANDHVAIERGRRSALRAIYDASSEVQEAVALRRAATRSTRKAAHVVLVAARRRALAAAGDEITRIEALASSIRCDARALTHAYWGTYLTIEASADQQRKMSLYEDDDVTPSDPRFRRWDPQYGEGQIGVQLQKGLLVRDALAAADRRLRIVMRDDRYGHVEMRVGSDGRDPIWTRFDFKMHRRMPDDAVIQWARLSRRREGRRMIWSVEITIMSLCHDRQAWRDADRGLDGWVLVEPAWEVRHDDTICAARWRDHAGKSGEMAVSARVVEGMARADRIRSVRAITMTEICKQIARALVEAGVAIPGLLADARSTIHLWRTPLRLYKLLDRWSAAEASIAPATLEALGAWAKRDDHLWRYEAGARGGACRARRETYRCWAAELGRSYRQVIVPDRDYSREARWGDESDVRFRAAPGELVACLDAVFGCDAMNAPWTRPKNLDADDAEPSEWIDLAGERLDRDDLPRTARKRRKSMNEQAKGGAWARRKAKKHERQSERSSAAREPDAKGVDSRVV